MQSYNVIILPLAERVMARDTDYIFSKKEYTCRVFCMDAKSLLLSLRY
ncbi:hypothetical protein C818_04270 [Lachnospiraceae bacterium MD308]|nr:hypothetical protein C818_04270 [Lachnospiraceae bacterium MD308]